RDHDRPAHPPQHRRARRDEAALRLRGLPVRPVRTARRAPCRSSHAAGPDGGGPARGPRAAGRSPAVISLYATYLVLPFVFRWLARLAAWTIGVIVAVMAAPVTVVTLAGLAVAWSRGWPPVRLRHAAAWSLPMAATWLAVTAVTTRSLQAVIAAPFTGWLASWHAFDYGATSTAFTLAAPVAVPAGLLLASVFWAGRLYRMDTGLAGVTSTGPVVFDERQWRRQAKAAQARSKAPGLVPLTDPRGRIAVGGT